MFRFTKVAELSCLSIILIYIKKIHTTFTQKDGKLEVGKCKNYLVVIPKMQDLLVLLKEHRVIVCMKPLSLTPIEIPLSISE